MIKGIENIEDEKMKELIIKFKQYIIMTTTYRIARSINECEYEYNGIIIDDLVEYINKRLGQTTKEKLELENINDSNLKKLKKMLKKQK